MFNKLFNGDYGLAKTFWLGCFLPNILWKFIFTIAFAMKLPRALILIIVVCFVLYFFAAYIGLWSASNKYQGSRFWVYISKFLVFLGLIALFASAFNFLVN